MTDKPPTTHDDLVEQEDQRMQTRSATLEAEAAAARQADLDSWRLCDEVSVNQAALLICNVSPSSPDGLYWRERQAHERPVGFDAARTALTSAVLAGRLKAKLRFAAWYLEFDSKRRDGEFILQLATPRQFDPAAVAEQIDHDSVDKTMNYSVSERPDWDDTMVLVEDLRHWLVSRGFSTGFFFAPGSAREIPGYLDPTHERFAPKLAAAVRAWEAVTFAGKSSPKMALQKWLREKAAELGLTDAKGRPLETPIDEISKVANWKSEGGAPKSGG